MTQAFLDGDPFSKGFFRRNLLFHVRDCRRLRHGSIWEGAFKKGPLNPGVVVTGAFGSGARLGFYLFVVAAYRVYHPSNLLCRKFARSFSNESFILSNFLLPLIEPEHHGQSCHFTCCAPKWGFAIRQNYI